jgi:CheY-like chemotaxis protein
MNVLTSVPRALPLTSWEHYILVVGDDPELLDSYRAALRKAGFAAVGVNHGVGALRLVETQVPSAIVLDLIPERLDGREVQRVLKSNPHTRAIPIVAVAGAEHEDIDLENVTCLLRKPLSVDALVVAVKHVVSQSSPPRAEAS